MDHEYETEHVKRRSVEAEAKAPPVTDAGLHTQMGNRAFAKAVQRAGTKSQGAGPLDPEIASDIGAAKGGGSALDDSTRADMEGNLGVDLSGVRVHTDSKADSLSRSVQAEAFTTGSDVFFKSGKYTPGSTDGRRLLAHELTHVVQQNSGEVNGGGQVSHPDDAHEHEARSVGDAVAASAPVQSSAPAQTTVHRQEDEEEEVQMSLDRQEDEEEEVQASVDRQEDEEEEVQASVDRQSVDRQEEEEEEMPG